MAERPRDLWTDEEFVERYGIRAESAGGRPVYLERLKRPKWTGRIRTYLIWCRRCRFTPQRGFTVTNPAGRAGRLHCSYCGTRYDHLPKVGESRDLLLNPHRHPWFFCFLLLVGLIVAVVAARPGAP